MTQPQDTPDVQEMDARLRRTLTALCPAAEPGPELAARVAALAARHDEKTRAAQASRFRWRLAAAAGAVLLALTVFQLTRPLIAAAAMLARMDGAMRDARSAHCVLNTLGPNGAWVKTNETWYQAGQWRMERDGAGHDIQVYTHGRLWAYEPQANTVTVVSQPGPFSYNSDGFSVSAMLGSGAFGTPPPQVQKLGDVSYGGRRAVQIAVVTPMHERLVFWADPDTNLPFHFEAQRTTPQGWQTGVEGDLTYNQTLPAALFVPDFPRTVKVVDKDAGVQALHEQWAKGITQNQTGRRRIVVRDVEVNSQGDVFLLYTAGHAPGDDANDHDIDVKGDAERDYTRDGVGLGFSPIFHDPRPAFMFGKEELEGYCLVPGADERASLRQSHSLTVTFRWDVTPWDRPAGPHVRLFQGEPATLTLPITRHITSEMPDYMPYMAEPLDKQKFGEMHTR